jgi:hypothetical protein
MESIAEVSTIRGPLHAPRLHIYTVDQHSAGTTSISGKKESGCRFGELAPSAWADYSVKDGSNGASVPYK